MEVNSFSFFAFLGLGSVLYRYLKSDKAAITTIAVLNLIFYLSGGWKYLPVLLFIVTVSYFSAIYVENCKVSEKKPHLGILIVTLLSLLLFFKYYNFVASIVNTVISFIGVSTVVPTHSFVWPIGISFFTFSAMGYVIDVHLGKIPANKDFVKHLAFVGFFPTISSGPIMRYDYFDKQISKARIFDYEQVCTGITKMLWGLVKKLVMADNIGKIVNSIYSSYSEMAGPFLILAAFLYTLQIYCDFAGYSDIAVGAAQVMGIDVKENFKRPFLAQDYGDFWKRWHISLTSWFQDYIFTPFVWINPLQKISSRFSKPPMTIATLIVFLVSGIWHGAGWSYIVWGILNGVFISIDKKTAKKRRKLNKNNPIYKNTIVKHIIQSGIVYLMFTATLVFFRLTDISVALSVVTGMFKGWTSIFNISYLASTLKSVGIGTVSGLLLMFNIVLLLFVELTEEKHKKHMSVIIREQTTATRIAIYYGLLCMIILFGNMARSSYIYNAF